MFVCFISGADMGLRLTWIFIIGKETPRMILRLDYAVFSLSNSDNVDTSLLEHLTLKQ